MKAPAVTSNGALENLYNRVTGDEDARVCKDIPEAACHDQPRNFFAYLSANLLGKVADEITSAKLVVPWLFGVLGVPAAVTFDWTWVTNELGLAIVFLLLSVMHGGVRLGRKVYLVDMASGENRAAYVAVSNTVIGVLMLVGGLIGLLADWLGAAGTVLLLGLLSLLAAAYAFRLAEVSQ